MSRITTHVLDLSTGAPAAGIAVTLAIMRGADQWEVLSTRKTDRDGRIRDFLPDSHSLQTGTYRLTFDTIPYSETRQTASFFPSVQIAFAIADPNSHYHVPLLLSPFGYSTYRGS